MSAIVKACVILHNMSVVERKAQCAGTRATKLAKEHDNLIGCHDLPVLHPPSDGDETNASGLTTYEESTRILKSEMCL